MLRVLSLGAGVQSSTLLLMAAAGELEHVPDAAIFADTGWEPARVYTWLDWLEDKVRGVIPIHRVSRGTDARSNTSIRDSYYIAQSTGKRYVQLPVYVLNSDGTIGMGRRQCTKEFKIEPIHRKVRELAGVKPRSRGPREVVVEQWMGISMDEAVRMKDSRVRWIRHSYPLVDMRWTRRDCLKWWSSRGLPAPPKSACIGCPYTDNSRWRQMRENAPEEFADAVDFDRLIRNGGARGKMRGQNFLHRSCVPLDQVDFRTLEEKGQGSLFGEHVQSATMAGWADERADEERAFHDECEGMCGV